MDVTFCNKTSPPDSVFEAPQTWGLTKDCTDGNYKEIYANGPSLAYGACPSLDYHLPGSAELRKMFPQTNLNDGR